jgi:hypothetical protein
MGVSSGAKELSRPLCGRLVPVSSVVYDLGFLSESWGRPEGTWGPTQRKSLWGIRRRIRSVTSSSHFSPFHLSLKSTIVELTMMNVASMERRGLGVTDDQPTGATSVAYQDINKVFGVGDDEFVALEDVNFSLSAGVW